LGTSKPDGSFEPLQRSLDGDDFKALRSGWTFRVGIAQVKQVI